MKFRFKVSILENSSAVGIENINYIKSYLNVSGFLVVDFILRAEDCGSPSRRERQYLLIVPVSTSEIDQLAEGFVSPPWVKDFLNTIEQLKLPPVDPQTFLLAPDSEVYCDWLHQAYSAPCCHRFSFACALCVTSQPALSLARRVFHFDGACFSFPSDCSATQACSTSGPWLVTSRHGLGASIVPVVTLGLRLVFAPCKIAVCLQTVCLARAARRSSTGRSWT